MDSKMKIVKRYLEPIMVARTEGGKKVIKGYALKYNVWSQNFGTYFREKILPGAVDHLLQTDIVGLFNHNVNMVLGRNKKTMTLFSDKVGLGFIIKEQKTKSFQDTFENVRLRNITGCSFSWPIDAQDDTWSPSLSPDVERDRIISKFHSIIDLGPVTFPAYSDTEIEVNSKREYLHYRAQSETPELDILEIQLNRMKFSHL